jgi:hypothetical protein
MGLHHATVNFVPIRLAQPHDQNSVVWLMTMLSKSLIGRDQKPLFSNGKIPEIGIAHALGPRSSHISHIVP